MAGKPDLNELKARISQSIDGQSRALRAVSLAIHGRPELALAEHYAHDLLTGELEREGFAVSRQACGMPTAFTARAGSGAPTIAILCEYDALPGIGHACGHNLIAVAGLAAAFALKSVLAPGEGTVAVIGTPAEEGGGGKQLMIDAGAFDGIDAAMMLHPGPVNATWFAAPALQGLDVVFHGRNAHAGMLPWAGVNALDAMVNAYVAVSTLRQQLQPSDRVHGVITDGGGKANIIPDRTAAEFYVRAATRARLEEVKSRVEACFTGAALTTGCTVQLQWGDTPYADMATNEAMATAYLANFREFGVDPSARGAQSAVDGISTDMGNVSYAVPSIHPFYAIPTEPDGANHTPGFAAAAATEAAHECTMRAAKALAMTALDLYLTPGLLGAAKAEFAASAG